MAVARKGEVAATRDVGPARSVGSRKKPIPTKSERCLCTGSAAHIRTPPELQSARHAFVSQLSLLVTFFLVPLAPL